MAYDLETLRALLARIESATGPSRHLDFDIATALGLLTPTQARFAWFMPACKDWLVTSSIDAAVALIERVLPGWTYSIWFGNGVKKAYVHKTWPFREAPYVVKGSTFPLALCAALIHALIATEENKSDA